MVWVWFPQPLLTHLALQPPAQPSMLNPATLLVATAAAVPALVLLAIATVGCA
jgi:hypothetical protein